MNWTNSSGRVFAAKAGKVTCLWTCTLPLLVCRDCKGNRVATLNHPRKTRFPMSLRRTEIFRRGGQKLWLPLKPAIFYHFLHILWVAKSQLGSVDTLLHSCRARPAYICLEMNLSNRSPAKCVGQQRESAWLTRSFWGARVRKGMNL